MGCASPSLEVDQFPKETVKLKVTGLQELDGKSSADIFALRDQAIAAEPKLRKVIPEKYKAASSPMLAGIGSGLPWFGAAGWACSSKESYPKHFADGESIESVPLANPWLLVALKSARASMAWSPDMAQFWPSEMVPSELKVDGSARKVICKYTWKGAPPSRALLAAEPDADIFVLNTVNAYDFGFNYCRVVQAQSQGVRVAAFDRAMDCRMAYKAGTVPDHPDLKVNCLTLTSSTLVPVKIDTFPIKLVMQLYRDAPVDASAQPVMTEEISLAKPW